MSTCNNCKKKEAIYNNGKCKTCNTEYMVEYRKTLNYKEYWEEVKTELEKL